MTEKRARVLGVLGVASVVGVMSGLFGVGGGVLLVPLLVLVFRFEQHRAQGTSLLALVPPTGLLALLNYWHAGEVDWRKGLLMVPGVFAGGMLGSRLAQKLSPRLMRRMFAACLFAVGVWQVFAARVR